MNFELPWIEKYRLNNINDLLLPSFIKSKLLHIYNSNTLPNMLLTGKPSTGKTSTVWFLVEKLSNADKSNILELRVSDDRGINIILNKISSFCKKATNEIKIIILDEADSIPIKSQHLLSVMIMEHINTVRFIFISNNIDKILDSIQTKCTIIKYPKISNSLLEKYVSNICIKEHINYDNETIKMLIFLCERDIRQILNCLECIKHAYGVLSIESLEKLLNKPPLIYINKIIYYIHIKARNKALQHTIKLYNKGYSAHNILHMLKFKYQIYNDILKLNIVVNSYVKCIIHDTLLQLIRCIIELIILE